MPRRQGVGFVEQLPPAVQLTHEPSPLQTRLVPQPTPASMPLVESTQSEVPVAHDTIPRRHTPGFMVHETPAVHATQAPDASHTWLVPQVVPAAANVAESVHCEAPEPQLVTPARHGLAFVEQALPDTQLAHAPRPSHTWSLPQAVPAGRFSVPSTQVAAPLGHVCVPRLQALGFVVHVTPAVHALHSPIVSQTRPPPQGVPGAALTPSTQVPVEHETFPCRQGAPAFEAQVLELPHEMHAPSPSQVLSTPQVPPLTPAAQLPESTGVR
jgi:hypothetical protein